MRGVYMQYIKAKFMKLDKPTGRAYTYRTEDDLKPGDIIKDAKGSKLQVMDEPVDMTWVEAYGADKVGVAKKYVEPESTKFAAEQTHCGQYKPYGDFVREWKIETDLSEEETLEKCFTELLKRKVPESAEYHREIRCNTGGHSGDAYYYFAGYYTLTGTENGYLFKVFEPYAD